MAMVTKRHVFTLVANGEVVKVVEVWQSYDTDFRSQYDYDRRKEALESNPNYIYIHNLFRKLREELGEKVQLKYETK